MLWQQSPRRDDAMCAQKAYTCAAGLGRDGGVGQATGLDSQTNEPRNQAQGAGGGRLGPERSAQHLHKKHPEADCTNDRLRESKAVALQPILQMKRVTFSWTPFYS